jgi:hypothetical protein
VRFWVNIARRAASNCTPTVFYVFWCRNRLSASNLLLARQTDQALECFLLFLAFVFGPFVGSLLFAFLFALLALPLTSNRKFLPLATRAVRRRVCPSNPRRIG